MGLLAPIFWLAVAPGPGGSQGNLIVPPASKDAESPSHLFPGRRGGGVNTLTGTMCNDVAMPIYETDNQTDEHPIYETDEEEFMPDRSTVVETASRP